MREYTWSLLLLTFALPIKAEMEFTISHAGLKVVPVSDIPVEVSKLIMEHTKISRIPNYTFSLYSSLEELTISHSRINDISPTAFSGTNLVYLSLRNNNITNIPDLNSVRFTLISLIMEANPLVDASFDDWGIFERLDYLNLYNCQLIVFPRVNWTYTMPQLKTLDVGKNLFSALSGDDIHPGVEFLYISRTSLNIISNTSAHSYAITVINFSRNKLIDSSLSYESFAGFSSLEELIASKNKLTIFPNITAVANTLQTLVISGNKITSFNFHCLTGFTKLSVINLNGNKFREFPDFHMADLPIPNQLETLHLKMNRINAISEVQMSPLTSLTKLDLSYNKLTELPELYKLSPVLEDLDLAENMFISEELQDLNLLSLTSLNIKGNDLESLPNLTNSLKSLQYLTLSDNAFMSHYSLEDFGNLLLEFTEMETLRIANLNLTTVPNLTSSLHSLTYLDARNNPLVCDLDLCWLKTAIQNYSLTVKLSSQPCSYPTMWQGINWTYGVLEDICSPQLGKHEHFENCLSIILLTLNFTLLIFSCVFCDIWVMSPFFLMCLSS